MSERGSLPSFVNSADLDGEREPVRRYGLVVGGTETPVLLGAHAWDSLAELIPAHWSRIVLVTQSAIPGTFALSFEATWVLIPAGEEAKKASVAEGLAQSLAELGLDRRSGLIAVGGGVVTDLVGFVASTYMRGIEYLNVATTLLGMVDAAVGGKTAVNLAGGKNLYGTFWQPTALLCDLAFLATLPSREWRSGAGELAKYSFLTSDPIAGLGLAQQIYAAQRLKESYVAGDEREAGRRSILNYGHTLGHAIEGVMLARGLHADISHGEAVAIGLVFAAMVAQRLGRIDEERVLLHRRVVEGYGLELSLPAGLRTEELVDFMRRDKKNYGGFSFVLDGPHGLELVHDIDESLIRSTLEEYLRMDVKRGKD
ncbi:3-dehydroquinate synthase family protein [Ferrimicrobium sp.]|uniref:3-dehydroquinate synthase n=1 Tax=Ferrimicrobium sp. TaxID=2926050 RepID=UPI002628EC54|nr:3-dehydroquinate synthase family protein [Ferrimicrobium sp.]